MAAPGAAAEAPAEPAPSTAPAETPGEELIWVVPAAPAVDASSEGAVAPASKKTRQYDLPPQEPMLPMPHLQPQLPTSSSSPSALEEPSLDEPDPKKHKQQHDDEDDVLPLDSFQPLQPTDPPVLPLSEHQPAAAADLEASKVRSRTHSEVSEAPDNSIS